MGTTGMQHWQVVALVIVMVLCSGKEGKQCGGEVTAQGWKPEQWERVVEGWGREWVRQVMVMVTKRVTFIFLSH
jgi:hypothetical protein